jgi:xanthine dehydrogenase FAD-binding subunit
MTQVILPESLDELWVAQERLPEARLYAGGTDLLARLRKEAGPTPDLICLERLAELQAIDERGGELFLGAGATHARLLASPLVRNRLPVLAQALACLGSPPVRNMGTLGGNLVTASPAGDSLPPLYVLGAQVELLSPGGERRLPIADFIQGPGRVDLRPSEIVAGVAVAPPPGEVLHHFEKVGRRQALAIAVVSLAALIRLDKGGVVEEARLAWGSVGPTVMASPTAEAALAGRPLSREALEEAAAAARLAMRPLDDVRASADYRRIVAGNLLLRLAGGVPPPT